MQKLFEKFPLLQQRWFLAIVYGIMAAGVTIQRVIFGKESYNNFLTFKYSFYNLIHQQPLYIMHPGQHQDLFKYSPTFALFMAPFYALPEWAGIFFWNLLNVAVPFFAVQQLKISQTAKAFILLFISFELLTSIQNSQSNGIMAGLIIAAFASMENKKPVMAALFICLGFYIKVFAAVAAVIFLFYDKKIRFLAACAVWGILLAVLPAVFGGFDQLILHYKDWLHLLAIDPSHELNFSIMTLTQRWFHFTASDSWYLIPGMILLLLPLIRKERWNDLNFRLAFIASVLVWVVIFNHKAESPTFVIAMSGAAIWGISQPPSLTKTILLWFVFILTGLSATDLFPLFIRKEIIVPYCLKALPCIVIWLVMIWRLVRPERLDVRPETLDARR